MLPFCCQSLNIFVCNPHKYWVYFYKILFEFYCSRWLTRQIIKYAINPCYQFVIKRRIELAETRRNTGFFNQLDLFKLYGRRWFPRTIVHHSIYVFYFIYNSACGLPNNFPRNFCALCSHEIRSRYRS